MKRIREALLSNGEKGSKKAQESVVEKQMKREISKGAESWGVKVVQSRKARKLAVAYSESIRSRNAQPK